MRALSASEWDALRHVGDKLIVEPGSAEDEALDRCVARGCVVLVPTGKFIDGNPVDKCVLTDLRRLALRVAVAVPAVTP